MSAAQMLTLPQRKLLIFICDYIEREKVAPSHDEMKVALGLASKSGVNRTLQCLVERGFVRTIPYRRRALEVLRGPDDKPRVVVVQESGFTLTPDEIKIICYLRTDEFIMGKILGMCP
jgi:SOS-response transcriptional repressor LexA